MKTGGKGICSSEKVVCTHVFQLENYFYEKQFLVAIEKLNVFNRVGGAGCLQDNEFESVNLIVQAAFP